MTYVTANLHGCYSQFKELLKQINFKEKDVMYILGDIVDWGDEPMELVCDLSMRYNVYPVAGEHDLVALRMLSGFDKMLKEKTQPDAGYIAQMKEWVENGGQTTLDGFRALDDEMKEGVLDYLADMALYEEDVNVGGKKYLLAHTLTRGQNCELDGGYFDMISELGDRNLDGEVLVCGHIPTSEIPGAQENSIFVTPSAIMLDCGAGRGGRIGCLRLEDGAEFYA